MMPIFVTVDDFRKYWSRDLNDMLRVTDNESDQANAFLFRVERRLMSWIDANTFRVVDFYNLSSFQLEQFRYAILEQAMYTWKNGDMGMDSGYDQERGMIADRSDLNFLVVCQPALDCLKNAGLYNQKIQNTKRFPTQDTFGIHKTSVRLSNPAFSEATAKNEPAQPIPPSPATEHVINIGYTDTSTSTNISGIGWTEEI